MSRYIDADALGIGRANREIFDNKAYADGWNSAIDIIVSAPTVNLSPCDVCAYNPPSSGDGKPCSICPAVKKEEEQQ